MARDIIRTQDIVKTYFEGEENELVVLKEINVTVQQGEFVSIVGPSGSGKSTMMQILGALDRPTSGEYWLDERSIIDMNDNELSDIRNSMIGFVFQTYNLIGRSTAIKNVELPMLYGGVPRGERRRRAKELLDLVGMGDRYNHQPNELSGGQKQRVAIARALANNPSLILADEPTGALDSKTGRQVMDLFHQIHEEQGATIVLITHNPELAEETDRILTLSDGVVISEVDKRNMNRPQDDLLRKLSRETETEIDTVLKAGYTESFQEGFSDAFREALYAELRKKIEAGQLQQIEQEGFSSRSIKSGGNV